MVQAPGRCMQCGASVAAPGLLQILGTVETLDMGDNISEGACPRCGGDVQVIDGSFNVQHGAFEMLSGPAWSQDVLDDLRLTLVRIVTENPEDPVAELAKTYPEVAAAVREAVPGSSPKDTLLMIAAIAGIIGATFSVADGVYHDIHPQQVIIEQTPSEPADLQRQVEQLLREVKARGTVVPPSPRNAPCPCGSGVKYKKCHGAPGMPGHQ